MPFGSSRNYASSLPSVAAGTALHRPSSGCPSMSSESVRGDGSPPLVSNGNFHAADEWGKVRQGTVSGIALSSPSGVEMRDIVSAAWCDAPGRVCST